MPPPTLDQARANATCAAVLVQALTHALAPGSKREVVLSPGSRSTPLVLALAAHPRVRLHVQLDERAAAFFALGLAQASGACVAVVTTSGSAPAHALPAAMEAHHAGVPLLLLSADRPAEAQDVGAAQTTPQRALFVAHARYTAQLPEPVAAVDAEGAALARRIAAAWQTAGVRALRAAEGPLPGCSHLNLPLREPLGVRAEAPEAWLPRPPPTVAAACGAGAASAQAEAALEALLGAPGPGVVYCGARLPASGPATAYARGVLALARALGWPVVAERLADLGPAEAAPLSVQASAPAMAALRAGGVGRVLHVGAAPLGREAQATLWQGPGIHRLVLAPEGSYPDPQHAAHALLLGDLAASLDAARAVVARRAPEPRAEAAQQTFVAALRAQEARATAVRQALSATATPWFEASAVAAAMAVLPADAQVVVGNSSMVRDLDAYVPTRGELTVWGRRGVSGIDGAIAHLVGVATAAPERPCIGLFGDLTLLHDLASLRLLASCAAPVVILVTHNAGGQIFAQLPIAANRAALPLFVTPEPMDLAKICGAFGVRHLRADGPQTLDQALHAVARPAPGACVLELVCPPEACAPARRATAARLMGREEPARP